MDMKTQGTKWRCKVCDTKNRVDRTYCRNCKTAKPASKPKLSEKQLAKIRQLIAKAKNNYRRVLLTECAPNPWNMNSMSADYKHKLGENIKEIISQTGQVPALWVRPHPKGAAPGVLYQILDGEQRWTKLMDMQDDPIVKSLYLGVVDVLVFEGLTEAYARILTETANYLRGEPDPDKHAYYLGSLVNDHGVTIAEAGRLLPQSSEDIRQTIDNYNIKIIHVEPPDDTDGADISGKEGDDDTFINLNFRVSKSAMEKVIQPELNRIAAVLPGKKNIMGRVLEYVCVLSSQTSTEELAAVTADHVEKTDTKGGLKTKLKAVARRN